MWGTFFISIAVVALIGFIALKGFIIVQQGETQVIERLGRYDRTLESGWAIIWPIVDKPRPLIWRQHRTLPDGKSANLTVSTKRIDLREQVFDFPQQNVITSDNVGIQIDALLYFQITDPFKAVYEVANLPMAIEKLTQTTLRNVLGEMDLDASLTSRDTINNRLRAILDEATDKWGVKVNRVELQDITPPKDVQEAMEKQMRAERDRRAAILNAEGEKRAKVLQSEGERESQINKAQGEKQSAVLRAEGEAEARMKVAEAEAKAIEKVNQSIADINGDPVSYLIAVRYLDTFKEMTSGQNNKVVYLPYEATALLGSVGGLKELFDGHGNKQAAKPITPPVMPN